jgi:hypothetical protein
LLAAGAGGTVQANGARSVLLAGLGQDWFLAHLAATAGGDVLVKKPGDTVTAI